MITTSGFTAPSLVSLTQIKLSDSRVLGEISRSHHQRDVGSLTQLLNPIEEGYGCQISTVYLMGAPVLIRSSVPGSHTSIPALVN